MNFSDLSSDAVESYRLDFLLDKTFDELFQSHDELSNDAKARLLVELSRLVVEFSPLFFGGSK